MSDLQMIGHLDIKGHDAIKRVYSPEGIAPTLTTCGGGYREVKILDLNLPTDIEMPTEGQEAPREVAATQFKSLADYTETELLAELMRRQAVNA